MAKAGQPSSSGQNVQRRGCATCLLLYSANLPAGKLAPRAIPSWRTRNADSGEENRPHGKFAIGVSVPVAVKAGCLECPGNSPALEPYPGRVLRLWARWNGTPKIPSHEVGRGVSGRTIQSLFFWNTPFGAFQGRHGSCAGGVSI